MVDGAFSHLYDSQKSIKETQMNVFLPLALTANTMLCVGFAYAIHRCWKRAANASWDEDWKQMSGGFGVALFACAEICSFIALGGGITHVLQAG
jgi:hypothetical protein